MQEDPDTQEPTREVWKGQRAVVLQVLDSDHAERWLQAELAGQISDIEPDALDEAVARLERDGVIHREGDSVWAARAARCLDELELIGV
jgi:DNA-binding HxlR family transcriptional regulator